MPFYISKIGFLLVTPSNIIGFTALLALVLLIIQKKDLAIRCFTLTAICVAVFGYSPLPNWALLSLENQFPAKSSTDAELKTADGIIILGGSFNPYLSHHKMQVSTNETSERVTEGVLLWRTMPNLKLIFTGGSVLQGDVYKPEAELAKIYMQNLGISTESIIFESKSLNTYENALFTASLLDPKPTQKWILVTSAFHMPRSVALFRAQGFNVIPYPVDYNLSGSDTLSRPHFSLTNGLSYADIAAKEWLGLFVYWMAGKIDTVFPKP